MKTVVIVCIIDENWGSMLFLKTYMQFIYKEMCLKCFSKINLRKGSH